MQTKSENQTVIPITAELLNALDIVVDLAEGNSLDPTDPDMEDDPDLLEQANCQLGAVDLVTEFLSMLAPGYLYLSSDDQCSSMNGVESKQSNGSIGDVPSSVLE